MIFLPKFFFQKFLLNTDVHFYYIYINMYRIYARIVVKMYIDNNVKPMVFYTVLTASYLRCTFTSRTINDCKLHTKY